MAVKEYFSSGATVGRSEAALLARLRHPHVLQFFGCSFSQVLCEACFGGVLALTAAVSAPRQEGRMYLVMELMDTSLQAHLDQHSPLRLPRASALQMALQIAQGLRHLHENQVCHRDLKPLNILLSFERGEHEPILKLADFGLSRSTNELSSMTAVVGTIQYMAPGDARMSSCYRTRACIS